VNKPALRHALISTLAHVPVRARPARMPPQKIVVIRPDHLGDLLFLTPALHALRQAFPAAHIACLVGPWGQPVLAGNPDIDELLACDFPWFNRRPKTASWAPYAQLRRDAARLARQDFDAALIMRFDFWWGAALARLAGIPARVGYNLADVLPFLTTPIAYQGGRHEVEQNLRLVEEARVLWGGAPVSASAGRPALRFTVPDDDLAWALSSVRPIVGAGRPLIAIHPGAGAAVKLWPPERWVALGKAIARRYDAAIVVTGGAGETGLAQAVAAPLESSLNLAGRTSLGQLAAVYSLCRLVLGADSGPLHLAVAAGAPTVHLFGPVDPALFGPWGRPGCNTVVQARFFDVPCLNRPCNKLDYGAAELPGHGCMQTITVDSALSAAEEVYASSCR
jgi:ADP-heptose:LPS heptosyltransferase